MAKNFKDKQFKMWMATRASDKQLAVLRAAGDGITLAGLQALRIRAVHTKSCILNGWLRREGKDALVRTQLGNEIVQNFTTRGVEELFVFNMPPDRNYHVQQMWQDVERTYRERQRTERRKG